MVGVDLNNCTICEGMHNYKVNNHDYGSSVLRHSRNNARFTHFYSTHFTVTLSCKGLLQFGFTPS